MKRNIVLDQAKAFIEPIGESQQALDKEQRYIVIREQHTYMPCEAAIYERKE
jgi:hypothetical protein